MSDMEAMRNDYLALCARLNDLDAMTEHNAFSGGDMSISGTTVAVIHGELMAVSQHLEGHPTAGSLTEWLELLDEQFRDPRLPGVYRGMDESDVCELSEAMRPWLAAMWEPLKEVFV